VPENLPSSAPGVGKPAECIMGKDEKALLRLWREKRGEEVPLDLSGVLLAQLGLVTEFYSFST
jgi:hypothetical protein